MSLSTITEVSQYLTFKLEEEVFALEISRVREVLEFTNVTKIPRTPNFMLGVINLRGNVVPIVDMRTEFGLAKIERTVDSRFIIMEIELDQERVVLGALVDSVQEVMELDPDHIEPPSCIGARLRSEFIRGMGKRNSDLIMILDIDRVFSSDELAVARDIGRETPS